MNSHEIPSKSHSLESKIFGLKTLGRAIYRCSKLFDFRLLFPFRMSFFDRIFLWLSKIQIFESAGNHFSDKCQVLVTFFPYSSRFFWRILKEGPIHGWYTFLWPQRCLLGEGCSIYRLYKQYFNEVWKAVWNDSWQLAKT